MSIPILSDILNTVRDMITWIVQMMPPIFKFLLFFLVVIAVGGFFQSTIFGIMGYQCDFNNRLYKSDTLNTIGNFNLMQSKPDASDFNVTGIKISGWCIQDSVNGSSGYNGQWCGNCQNDGKVCLSDSYRGSWSWWLGWHCGALGCSPPEGFKYDYRGLGQKEYYYVCWNNTNGLCDNFNAEHNNAKIQEEWSRRIQDSGGQLVETDMNTYQGISNVKCINSDPKWTVFGIEVLNPLIWVFVIILVFLIMFFLNHM